MSTIPKIVRDRLKATPPAVNHPDADVLTAFAEQSLPDRERATVIEHLARCGDCRDVVALALLPTETLEAAATPTHRSSWLTWPTLRWAFVAAGVIAIASFGVMRVQRRSETVASQALKSPQAPFIEAKNESPAPPPASAPATKEDKAAPKSEQTELASSPNQNGVVLLPKSAPSPDASLVHQPQVRGGVAGYAGARVGGPAMPSQQQTASQQTLTRQGALSKQRADSSLAVQAPSGSETVEVSGQATQVAVEAENQKAELRDQSAAPAAEFDAYSGGVGKAKPAATPEAARAVPAPAPPMPTAAKAQLAAAKSLPPRWTISPAGSLQRSFDQGNSWQDVNVLASAAMSENFMSYSISSDTASAGKVARSKEKDADKKALKQEVALIFRAVTAIGSDVWAGGQQGILYHSIDAGNHWTRIVPGSAGLFLTGDILTVEFPDTQHGRATTSTAEAWTTSDAGQTWQKQ